MAEKLNNVLAIPQSGIYNSPLALSLTLNNSFTLSNLVEEGATSSTYFNGDGGYSNVVDGIVYMVANLNSGTPETILKYDIENDTFDYLADLGVYVHGCEVINLGEYVYIGGGKLYTKFSKINKITGVVTVIEDYATTIVHKGEKIYYHKYGSVYEFDVILETIKEIMSFNRLSDRFTIRSDDTTNKLYIVYREQSEIVILDIENKTVEYKDVVNFNGYGDDCLILIKNGFLFIIGRGISLRIFLYEEKLKALKIENKTTSGTTYYPDIYGCHFEYNDVFYYMGGYKDENIKITPDTSILPKINYLQCEPGFPEGLEVMSEYLEPILISNKTEIQTKVVSNDIAYLDSDIVKYRYYTTDKTIVELDYISTLSDTINMNDMNNDKPKGLISFYKDDIIIAPEFIDFFIDFNEDGTINIEYFALYETETEAYAKYLKFENITIIFEQLGGNYMHLGLCELGIAELGSTDYVKAGDTKESISLEVAVEMQKTTTAEKGNATVEAIFSSQTGKITLTLVPVKKEDLQKYFPHFDGTKFANKIGQIVPKKKVKLHPIELGNDLSLDVIFGKAIITPKYNKANKDASTIELEIEALFDENDVQFYVGIENDPDYVAP